MITSFRISTQSSKIGQSASTTYPRVFSPYNLFSYLICLTLEKQLNGRKDVWLICYLLVVDTKLHPCALLSYDAVNLTENIGVTNGRTRKIGFVILNLSHAYTT